MNEINWIRYSTDGGALVSNLMRRMVRMLALRKRSEKTKIIGIKPLLIRLFEWIRKDCFSAHFQHDESVVFHDDNFGRWPLFALGFLSGTALS